jgi:beta-glucosidase
VGNDIVGTSILKGIQNNVSVNTQVVFDASGQFTTETDANGNPLIANVGIVVVGETPYAEGVGDKADMSLSIEDISVINLMRERSKTLIVVIISGRPLIITDQFQTADAWVAAWLPGTEGEGIADVLFGDYPFTGKLSYTWPRSNEQLPLNINNIGSRQGCDGPLFPYGYGLGEAGSQPIPWLDCP